MWQPQGFYNQYVLRAPAVLSGMESIRGLYNYPAARVAVIHGKSFKDAELFQTTFAKADISFMLRSWPGEPDMEGLEGTLRQLEIFQPDLIIAVGGGSVLDGSKLCRILYEFPWYEAERSRIEEEMFHTNFIAVPTTVGSGAEVSSAAVFVDKKFHRKDMVVLHGLLPDVIVYDKRYVSHTPHRLLCASALDAMAHILEGYVSVIDNFMIDIMAEEGMAVLVEELVKVIDQKMEAIDYQRLQYAGYIGGFVQNHCIAGAAHAVAHQLTEYGYSHGEAVGLVLPLVIELNAGDSKTCEKYQRLAVRSGFTDIHKMVDFVRTVLECSGIEGQRKDFSALLQELQQDALFLENVKNDRGGQGNPVKITDDFIRSIGYGFINR